jgi:hypothetical protein
MDADFLFAALLFTDAGADRGLGMDGFGRGLLIDRCAK